jgi:glycosyltransferase involved in cell wall biosynthesis
VKSPVEAMGAGAPVLAQREGGAAESVVHGVTGALVGFDDLDELREGVATALATDRADRVARARRFAAGRFRAEITDWVRGV